MADNIKKVTVIDFFGLPGCGKSTVSHLLAEKLCKNGYKVLEPSYDLDHNLSCNKRKFVKLGQYILYSLIHPVKSCKVSKLVKNSGYGEFSQVLSQRINITTKLVALKKTGLDYIIFDEGFCQAAISLSFNGGICGDVASNYESIIEIYDNAADLKPVYLKAEIETAMKNMKTRAGHDSRADAETDDTKRYEMVSDFYKLCEHLKDIAFTMQEVQNDEHLTVESVLKSIVCK